MRAPDEFKFLLCAVGWVKQDELQGGSGEVGAGWKVLEGPGRGV